MKSALKMESMEIQTQMNTFFDKFEKRTLLKKNFHNHSYKIRLTSIDN